MREILRDLRDTPDSRSGLSPDSAVSRRPLGAPGRLRPSGLPVDEKPKNFKYGDLKVLIPFARPHWKVGLAAGVTALAGTIAAIAIPLSFRSLADDAVLGRNHELLNAIILAVVGVFSFVALA